MAVLLTGINGMTSINIAKLCQQHNVPFVCTSRNGQKGAPDGSMPTVSMDWNDRASFEGPFRYKFENGEKIKSVYLVTGRVADPVPKFNAFIDYAKTQGVERFVLCGGTSVEQGDSYMGAIWQHFVDIGVEYCVLRPSWFMENLLGPGHFDTVKHLSKIYTACGDGKIAFVSAVDIAAMGFAALTDNEAPNCSYRVLGPELLTWDEVAAMLGTILGRQIEHVHLNDADRKKGYMEHGVPEETANLLVWLEGNARQGKEALVGGAVEEVTGKKPMSYEDFLNKNKNAW